MNSINSTMQEILEFVKTNDIRLVRLGFCDLFGMHKNLAIPAEQLETAFTTGISFDASSINGFLDAKDSDLFLFPDPTTLTLLPWRPDSGRVIRFYCDIKKPNTEIFTGDSRNILKQAVERLKNNGYNCKIGVESEFYLFKTNESGELTKTPIDKGGYLDISPLDKGADIRREICFSLDKMGLNPETSHHEEGFGQNEIDFKFSDPLSSADNVLTFKSVVKSIAERNGLFASFLPKPLLNQSGSGLHINLSIYDNHNKNLYNEDNPESQLIAESFIQGILDKIPDMTVFLNSIPNSYERLGSHKAPKYVSWSHQNRSQLIRIPATNTNDIRIEIRSGDSAINPYITFALILHAGMNGIEKNLKLVPPVNENLYTANYEITKNLQTIPNSLKEAILIAKNSDFINKYIDEVTLNKYLEYKENEFMQYDLAVDKNKINDDVYFPMI